MILCCPSCNAKLSASLQVEQPGPAASSSAPPVPSAPRPGTHVAPPKEETAKERAAREAEYERLFRGSTQAVQTVCLNLIEVRMNDRRREVNGLMGRTGEALNLPLQNEDRIRKQIRAEVLEQEVRRGYLKPRAYVPNEPSNALPRGDRDDDQNEEE